MLFFEVILSGVDYFFFFFNDTATTEIYTLSLHDALPISLMSNDVNSDLHRRGMMWIVMYTEEE